MNSSMSSLKELCHKGGLGRSLQGLTQADRLSAAWIVVCGRTMAERGEIVDFKEGVLVLEVEGGPWLEHFRSIRSDLAQELARVAGLPVTGINFVVKR